MIPVPVTWKDCAAAGMSVKEAAVHMGCTEKAAKSYAKRHSIHFRRIMGVETSDAYKGGAPSSDIKHPPAGRGAKRGATPTPNRPAPDKPRLINGAYDAAGLQRYLADANLCGMTPADIARALNVEDLSRIHYFQTPDGKRALERRAAKTA